MLIHERISENQMNKYHLLCNYAPTSNAEAEVERFYEHQQDLLEETPKEDVLSL